MSARRAALEARSLVALVRAGVFGVELPHRLLQILRALADFGPFGAAPRIAAIRHGKRSAIVDEQGELTFAELDEQVNRLANALRGRGLGPGTSLGILARNHRAPLIAAFAASRTADAEFADVVADLAPPAGRVACEQLLAGADPAPPPAPERPGRIVLLTSGTTGTPKGAPRPEPRSLTLPGALLERMPMRAREATVLGPPLYHGTGLLIALLSISLGSKLILRRRFDAAQFIDDVDRHRATTVCVVPIMLQRVLALGDDEVRRRDLSSLRVVFCAGSQLPAEVAIKAMDLLGDVIYNLYGSTEVSVATLATPEDIRAAPTSVGRPALGSRVKVIDGRIFVGTTSPFEGYTGGGGKEVVDGLLSTGDLGHFDDQGRLYIDGREDEMIVSGGENVFPREVEELLITHPGVDDVAVIGVDDAEFGQRLRAFVVRISDEVSAEQLQAFAKENLARFKVPREVVFLGELPRNPTGKILKRELTEL